MTDNDSPVNPCWYCRSEIIWDSDFNYDEVHGEGDGIVTFLHCPVCGAEIMYSLREDEEDDEDG